MEEPHFFLRAVGASREPAMGVPRFFRFLVERYPLILRDYGLPVPVGGEAEREGSSSSKHSHHHSPNQQPTSTSSSSPSASASHGGCPRLQEIDNFYLDFNGVVHTCTHGNTDVVRTQKVRKAGGWRWLELVRLLQTSCLAAGRAVLRGWQTMRQDAKQARRLKSIVVLAV